MPKALHLPRRGLKAAAAEGQEARVAESKAKEAAAKAPKFVPGSAPSAAVDSWVAHMERELAPAELAELQGAPSSRTKPVDAPDHPDFKVCKLWTFHKIWDHGLVRGF